MVLGDALHCVPPGLSPLMLTCMPTLPSLWTWMSSLMPTMVSLMPTVFFFLRQC